MTQSEFVAKKPRATGKNGVPELQSGGLPARRNTSAYSETRIYDLELVLHHLLMVLSL
jgi:hypothetical protein